MTRRRAFTVVELLVVIGAITILIGMIFVGIGYAHKTISTRTTVAQLGNLKGMLVELDTANGLKTSPAVWLWWSPSGAIVNAPASTNGGYSVDFWRSPPRSPNTASGTFDCLNAPGSFNDDSGNPADRNAQPAVVNTTIAMQMLAALPANRSRLQNVGQKSTFIPTRVEPAQQVTTPNGGQTAASYAPLAQVQYNGKYYIGSATFTVPGNPTPGGSTEWTESPTRTAPMLLDGWNNPIIFVPATGLRVRLLNGNKDYKDAGGNWSPNTDFIVISPEGRAVKANTTQAQDGNNPAVQQIGRPFFASAGPDGSFEKGDDNIYSFNQ